MYYFGYSYIVCVLINVVELLEGIMHCSCGVLGILMHVHCLCNMLVYVYRCLCMKFKDH